MRSRHVHTSAHHQKTRLLWEKLQLVLVLEQVLLLQWRKQRKRLLRLLQELEPVVVVVLLQLPLPSRALPSLLRLLVQPVPVQAYLLLHRRPQPARKRHQLPLLVLEQQRMQP